MSKRISTGMPSCSFCGKNQKEAKKLIAGPTVYICDECIRLCNNIISEDFENDNKQKKASLIIPKPAEIKEVLDEYYHGGVFAMPSVYESFGLVYLEAICLGMPVVASKGTGADDIVINGKNGFLAKKRDPKSIADALLSAQKLFGKVPKPDNKFLWKNIAKEYEKVILHVLM